MVDENEHVMIDAADDAQAGDAGVKASPSKSTERVMIEARGLCKYYGQFVAIENISFTVPQRQVCAFLGPNGAGKSTTMKLLTGFLAPSAGAAFIGGHDVYAERIQAAQLIGYLPENGPLYPEMTPESILKYLGEVRGMKPDFLRQRLDFVAEKCSLKAVWGKPISKLSRGYKQRVGMAQALLHDPEVLILDEPTSGLDPNQVHDVRELITSLSQTKTILLSTHILQEVKAMCSRVIVVNNGRLVFDGGVNDMEQSNMNMESRFRQLTLGKS